MNILWFTWKDKKNPLAGGAEFVNEELASRLIKDGHKVTFLVGGYEKCIKEEITDGYKIIRLGNKYSIYLDAYNYYKKHLKNWPDVIIEEINTIPFLTNFYIKKKKILFIHQLCRVIWFYEMFFPLNIVGYLLEPFYLWLLRNNNVITVSESTKKDLIKFGFNKKKISIITEAIELERVSNLKDIKKYSNPTVLSLGSIRSMKRTIHQLKAFEIAKEQIPNLHLKIAGVGNGNYYNKFLNEIKRSKYANDIEYIGKASKDEKIELMRKSHLILCTSVKEGWGLIVTEANSQGTPAIVYNVDGFRDSVKNKLTGIVCKENNPSDLAQNIIYILNNKKLYNKMRINCWKDSKMYTLSTSYRDFKQRILY